MNREIKFRGKRIDNGEWVVGDLLHPITSCRIVNYTETKEYGMEGADYHYYDVDPDTVGQYTGLKDRNGKEIYEGDMVQQFWGSPHYRGGVYYDCYSRIGKVVFRSPSFCLIAEDGIAYHLSSIGIKHEVIGNIHDNPELLKTE